MAAFPTLLLGCILVLFAMTAVQVGSERGPAEASPAVEHLQGHGVDEAHLADSHKADNHRADGHTVDGDAHDGHTHYEYKEGNWIVSFLDGAKDADYEGFIAWLEGKGIPIPDRANESYIKYVVITPTPEQVEAIKAHSAEFKIEDVAKDTPLWEDDDKDEL